MKWIPFSPNWDESIVPPTPLPPPPEAVFGADPKTSSVASRKVLVAEDDPVSREILTSLLKKWGYQVIVAEDGREAMEALRAEKEPILALLDWMMPGMDGLEICRRVREIGKAIYVLLLTARAGKERVVEGLQAGADDYIVKPFDKDELRARLSVGARVLDLQSTLSARVQELEALVVENRELKLQMPL